MRRRETLTVGGDESLPLPGTPDVRTQFSRTPVVHAYFPPRIAGDV
jgi:hypothetical protein